MNSVKKLENRKSSLSVLYLVTVYSWEACMRHWRC